MLSVHWLSDNGWRAAARETGQLPSKRNPIGWEAVTLGGVLMVMCPRSSEMPALELSKTPPLECATSRELLPPGSNDVVDEQAAERTTLVIRFGLVLRTPLILD